jgi:hypothetical protein
MKSLRQNWIWMVVAGAVLLPMAVVFWPFRFYYDSFCAQCGAEKFTTEWEAAGSGCDWTLFRRSFVRPTPMSQYLSSSGLVGNHPHVWLFAHGDGNGVRCALGGGDALRTAVDSLSMVQLLQSAKKYGGRNECEKLLHLTLDPDTSRSVLTMAALFPTNGFSDKEEYENWMTDNKWVIDEAPLAPR